MPLKFLALVAAFLSFPWLSHAQEEYEHHWVLKRPGDLVTLPLSIRRSLERRRCAIAQDTTWHQQHNVVRGALALPGQQDVAVLCIRGTSAKILIYWAGQASRLDSLSVDVSPGHSITVADPTYIKEHAENYGWPNDLPRTISHDGIEVGSGCCSQIYYRHRGRWILTPGAD